MGFILRLPFLMSIMAGLVISCSSGSNGSDDGEKPKYSIFNNLRQFDYVNGLKNADQMSEEDLVKAYNEWYSYYVVDGGKDTKGRTTLRVQRDPSSDYDTVSEGMAYGMLLAVYFNDQVTFDKLYGYVLKHLVPKTNLMHWKVLKTGVNISEFRIPVPHGPAFLLRDDFKKPEEQRKYIASVSQDGTPMTEGDVPDWASMARKEFNIPEIKIGMKQEEIDAITAELTSKAAVVEKRYIQACKYDRKLSSAADADFDIAMALIIACKKWQNTSYPNMATSTFAFDYREEAAKCIKSIFKQQQSSQPSLASGDIDYKTSGKAFITNGTAWGGQSCWNPSYFMPAWFRAYKEFIIQYKSVPKVANVFGTSTSANDLASKCDLVIKTMYDEMHKINAVNGTSGLYPDWCDTSSADNSVKKPSAGNSGSDRVYFLDLDKDGKIDDWNNEKDERKADSKITYEDGYDRMSTNFYYDAVRVPWRLATDYAWYGSEDAKVLLTETSTWLRGRYNKAPEGILDDSTCLYDGYSIDGSIWNPDNRDGFNSPVGGNNYSTAFVAMCAPASLILADDQKNAEEWMKRVIAKKELTQMKDDGSANQYTYYGNTLRLLSLVFMSGKFTNPEAVVALKSVDSNKYMTRWVPEDSEEPVLFWGDPYNGSDTIGVGEKFGLISLGGSRVVLRSYTTSTIIRAAVDRNRYVFLTDGLKGTTDNADLYDIHPNAIFTMMDLHESDGTVSSHKAFLNQRLSGYLYSTVIDSSWGEYYPANVVKKNVGVLDSDGGFNTQLAFDIEPVNEPVVNSSFIK